MSRLALLSVSPSAKWAMMVWGLVCVVPTMAWGLFAGLYLPVPPGPLSALYPPGVYLIALTVMFGGMGVLWWRDYH